MSQQGASLFGLIGFPNVSHNEKFLALMGKKKSILTPIISRRSLSAMNVYGGVSRLGSTEPWGEQELCELGDRRSKPRFGNIDVGTTVR